MLVYRYAPAAAKPIAWRDALPGTIAGVAMWLIATLLFRTYVAHVARFDSTSLTFMLDWVPEPVCQT